MGQVLCAAPPYNNIQSIMDHPALPVVHDIGCYVVEGY